MNMPEPEEDDDGFNQEEVDQKAMNRRAWKLLVDKGYTSDQKIKLDFVFVTESRSNANKLKALLETETDYTLKVINNDDEFELDGQTGELQLSLEALNQWTAWIVEEGHKCGCTFDGWTTPLAMKTKPSRPL